MKRAAITKAHRRLRQCTGAIEKLKVANGNGAAHDAWSIFLYAANGLYEDLRRGAAKDPITSVWFAAKEQFRIDDQLLNYLHHARNSEEHSIADIVDLEPVHLVVPPGGAVTVQDVARGVWQVVEQSDGVAVVPEKLTLRPVIDRYKVEYLPPTTHAGVAIADASAINAALLALAYFEKLVAEADGFVDA
jgi:hypothetical protein